MDPFVEYIPELSDSKIWLQKEFLCVRSFYAFETSIYDGAENITA